MNEREGDSLPTISVAKNSHSPFIAGWKSNKGVRGACLYDIQNDFFSGGVSMQASNPDKRETFHIYPKWDLSL